MELESAYDVIVLGSGIAGLAAALTAHERGLSALLIEKADLLGGTTSDSYGLVWIGDNPVMRQAGLDDSRSEIAGYMDFLGGGELSEPRMTMLVEQGPATLACCMRWGIPFQLVRGVVDHYFGIAPGASALGRTVEAGLVSGFDLGDWRDRIRKPEGAPCFVTAEEQVAWGGMNRFPHWDRDIVRDRLARDMRGKGFGLVTHFVKALLARGVPIVTGLATERLLCRDGAVRGIVAATGREVVARKGVVLATGGYEWNAELMRDFDFIPGLEPLSPPSLTGDGLIMGAEIGAAIRRIQNNLNLMLGFSVQPDDPAAPPSRSLAGISELCSPHTLVVNRDGQRFGDESFFQALVPELRRFDVIRHRHANLPCYLIFDAQFVAAYSFAHLPSGTALPRSVPRDATLVGLAGQLGIDPAGLVATVERFNQHARDGIDRDFGRGAMKWGLAKREPGVAPNRSLGAISEPPFHGIALHPTLGTSSAGLATNAQAQVLHQRRHPIPGLYASGVVAARTELGTGYQAGLNLASGMTFSRLAVEHMAQRS
jgi:succinate dehydrogenase/fumarate reductase flavoprotein subunit